MTPGVYKSQLAMLTKEPPDGEQWLHELKYDGYRIGCLIARGAVTLISRCDNDWTAQFPEIAAAARTLKVSDALLDGERSERCMHAKLNYVAWTRGRTCEGSQ
jgi:bifunctional non-homologous end joining protein LigD